MIFCVCGLLFCVAIFNKSNLTRMGGIARLDSDYGI
jgi:hypothetical protein